MLTLEAQLTIRDAIVLPRPLVKWGFEAPDPDSVPAVINSVPAVITRAAHIAMAAPSGPVFVSVPLDNWHHEQTLTIPHSLQRGMSQQDRSLLLTY
jgi:benzoylformate decarboxylase